MGTNVNGFVMENAEKVERAIQGNMGRQGVLQGGLVDQHGADVLETNPELVLAHYDKLAGYITKDGVKVKTGSFWDFKKKAPRETPEVLYVFNIGGDKVEVDDPKNLAQAISTVEAVRVEKEEKVKVKRAKSKFKEVKE